MSIKNDNANLDQKTSEQIALILDYNEIALDERENAVYETQKQLDQASRETFYLIVKTDDGWKKLFKWIISLMVIFIIIEVFFKLPNYLSNNFAKFVLGLFTINSIVLPIWKFFINKNTLMEFCRVFFYPTKYIIPALILSLTYNAMQIKLCNLIHGIVGSERNVLLSLVFSVSIIALFAILIHLIRHLLCVIHKKWKFLNVKSMLLCSFAFCFLIIIFPILTTFESFSVKNVAGSTQEEILFYAQLCCISGILAFIYVTIIVENFSVTKKYKAKYALLLQDKK